MKANRKKTARKTAKPITETLLELAYLLHTTKVVGVRRESEPRQEPAPKRHRSEGSPLAS